MEIGEEKMEFTHTAWMETTKNRLDMTNLLTHLTRPLPQFNLTATDVLIKILRERTLIGSTTESGFIIGNRRAVCFQDAPLYSIAQNSINYIEEYEREPKGKLRYYPCGLAFPKNSLYTLYSNFDETVIPGARPVIYEKKEVAKTMLPPHEYWRIVSLDLGSGQSDYGIINWTQEREWRIPVDSFGFHYNSVYVLLRNQLQYQEFISKIEIEIVKQLAGIICLEPLLY